MRPRCRSPKRRSESVLSTSSTNSVEPGDGGSTSPDPTTSDLHHSKRTRLGGPVDEIPCSILTLYLGRLAGVSQLLASLIADSMFSLPTQPPQPAVPPHYSL
ncbi:hypothetical protein Pcinc_006604 [Petrolisthes cinctipes]|uniref:Uncharacterized protein n=1 Tax=Petrolisthes cinctipes TaxID=88211 RepID=A0AAE1GCK2_PETCI|nr:hypothetical protein Pcinc_006604 [Petrolisthes cinctipes]